MRALLTALTCAIALAACGSSGTPSTAASNQDAGLKFAKCMRSHGVSNFPDPSAGGALQFSQSSGVKPQSPAFQSAQGACKRYLPIKGPSSTHMSATELRKAFAFARCMRSHGVPSFPDPTQNASPRNGASQVLALDGMFFQPGPGSDPKSPAFQQAISRCGVRPPRGAQPQTAP